MHLADAFIQSDLQIYTIYTKHSGYNLVLPKN